jgi:hypothetical protein
MLVEEKSESFDEEDAMGEDLRHNVLWRKALKPVRRDQRDMAEVITIRSFLWFFLFPFHSNELFYLSCCIQTVQNRRSHQFMFPNRPYLPKFLLVCTQAFSYQVKKLSVRIRKGVRFCLPVHLKVKLAIHLFRKSSPNHGQLTFVELATWRSAHHRKL